MLIPPPYLGLLDPPKARAGGTRHRSAARILATTLLAAASGAAADGLTAWLVLVAAS